MNPIGIIENPLNTVSNGQTPYTDVTKLPLFISNMLKLLTIGAGIFAMVNFLIAGITYIGSNGNEKKIETAIAQINFSIIGLAVMAASYVLIAVISYILFKDPTVILNPTIYGPGDI